MERHARWHAHGQELASKAGKMTHNVLINIANRATIIKRYLLQFCCFESLTYDNNVQVVVRDFESLFLVETSWKGFIFHSFVSWIQVLSAMWATLLSNERLLFLCLLRIVNITRHHTEHIIVQTKAATWCELTSASYPCHPAEDFHQPVQISTVNKFGWMVSY